MAREELPIGQHLPLSNRLRHPTYGREVREMRVFDTVTAKVETFAREIESKKSGTPVIEREESKWEYSLE